VGEKIDCPTSFGAFQTRRGPILIWSNAPGFFDDHSARTDPNEPLGRVHALSRRELHARAA
jgi:hypothetical protein